MTDEHKDPFFNHPVTISYYAILYMDVLNQREKLSKIGDLPINQAEQELFLALLRDTYGVIDGFARMFESALLVNRTAPPPDIPENHRQQLDRIFGPPIGKFLFSDSMLYYISLNEQEGAIPTIRLHELLVAAASVFVGGLSDGNPARGGLEIGVAANFPRVGIYGPGLYKAYTLESETAQYPRVVVGPTLRDYLITYSEDPETTKEAALRRDYAQKCLGLIYDDSDGVQALDYAGEGVRQSYPALGQFIIKAMDFAQTELKRFQQQGNDKLSSRYLLLVNYLTDRVQRFWE
jgi:hypothetical protein